MTNWKPGAVLFDLDGTLLNTIPDIAGAMNRALAAEGLPQRDVAEFGHIIGSGIRVAIRRAAPEGTDEQTLERIHTRYQGDYPTHCTVDTQVYDGICQLLAMLQAAGVVLGVITNKTEATAQQMIAHYFPENAFQFVWGSNGVRPLKPAAEVGTLACQTLGLPPEAVAFVGDSDVDIQFARAAGFFPVGAVWGFRSAAELEAAGAAWLCDTPAALQTRLQMTLT